MPALNRSPIERRCGKDRRKRVSLVRFSYKGPNRRGFQDRRSLQERRDGWVRISKWSSVYLSDLKIAKYLR
jgi:hypothetical protein